jgi:hypothetical protein
MIRTYEASVLSVEPRGDHQLVTVRTRGLGTIAVEVGAGHPVQAGDVRMLTVEMGLDQLIGRDEQPAEYR